MRKIKNSEPVFHTHKCADADKGRQMTEDELRSFIVECLMEEYADTGAVVTRLERRSDDMPDFTFTSMDKIISVAVRCTGLRSYDIPDFDPSWMQEDYRKTGRIPRLTIVRCWCVADGVKGGEPAVCGGVFCLLSQSFSLLPDEVNPELEKHLSDLELADKYAQAWKEFDAEIVKPYLDKDFHYSSEWVYDELPSRFEFMDYFKGKLISIADGNDYPRITLMRSRREHKCALKIAQRKATNYLLLKMDDGRITSARMAEHADGYEEADLDDNLYQGHGNHIEAVMDSDEFMHNRFQEVMNNSKLFKTSRMRFSDEDIDNEKVSILALRHGEGDMSFLSEIAFVFRKQQNLFVSTFPMMKGDDIEVTIDRIHVWDNLVEATVDCSVGEFEFSFFAVDYYANASKYKVGEKITVSLAALAMRASLSPDSFSFEGQQAVDWLAKTGQKPDYDENGNVKPVVFGLRNLVSYLALDRRGPDEAEFQSPVSGLESESLLGIDFWKSEITVHRSLDGDSEIHLPLYFRKDMIPDVKEDDPVRGWLWMTGYIAGENEADESDSKTFSPAEFCEDFENFMGHLNTSKGFDDINFITDNLNQIKIRDGYVLDGFKTWKDGAPEFRIYGTKKGSVVRYLPTGMVQEEIDDYLDNDLVRGKVPCEFPPFSDEMYIHESIPLKYADMVPDHMNYVSVPFTEEGVTQGWLLHILPELMTKYYLHIRDRKFIFSPGFKDKDGRVCQVPVTSVTIDGDTATVNYTYYSDEDGLLYRASVKAIRNGDSISFGKEESEILKYAE